MYVSVMALSCPPASGNKKKKGKANTLPQRRRVSYFCRNRPYGPVSTIRTQRNLHTNFGNATRIVFYARNVLKLLTICFYEFLNTTVMGDRVISI